MKIKVGFWDGKLKEKYYGVLSFISVIFSFVLMFAGVPEGYELRGAIALLFIFLLIYVIMWVWANFKLMKTLNINNSTLVVKVGDIFAEDELKVIAFNEYFDTQVDNVIISERSLHGRYINSLISDVNDLDNQIDSNPILNQKVVETNSNRPVGKKKKYELGTIFKKDDFLLTAFTKFDDNNRAYLSMNDYIDFLLNFWNEIDIIYAGRSVSIPLLGSGITRFKECGLITEQELLELLIWSFKVSRTRFTYPSKVSIIIHESKQDKINFYNLKE